MALTVLQEPQTWQPAYNENIFVVRSTNALTKYKFKYICNVYRGDGTFITALKTPVYPSATSGEAYVNVGRIVENYLEDYFLNATGSPVLASGSAWANYGVRFGEEYSDTSSGAVVAMATSAFTAATYYNIWDACLKHRDMISYDDDTYMLNTTGTTGQWLTNRPRRTKLVQGFATSCVYAEFTNTERAWLYGIVKPGQSVSVMYRFLSGASGSLIAEHQLLIDAGCRMIRIPASYKSITEHLGVTYGSATAVTFLVENSPYSIANTNYFHLIVDGCDRYDRQLIHFLNRLGGWDTFAFTMKSEVTTDIERAQFQKKVGNFNSTTYSYSQYDRGRTIYDTSEKDKYRFNSDWLTEEEYTWLAELVSAPKAFLDGTPGTPLIVDTNSFRYIKKQNEPLVQLEFTASLTIDHNRQRA